MQRFVETTNIDNKLFRKLEGRELQECLEKIPVGKLQESLGTSTTPTSGWEVPISKYDVPNGNGRLYPKSLWENVINNQRNTWQGSPMLADHPVDDSDGSPGNICGVWVDGRVGSDGYVYGTLVPSGRLGADFKEHLSNGLKAGTSSSGFGELMSDRLTVDPDTFQIERLSDWVLTPSQGTYFTLGENSTGIKNASDSRMGESAHKQESVVLKETRRMDKISKLEEKKFRRDMESFLNEASKITDPQGRLKEFEEILSYLEEGMCPDLRESVQNKIKADQEYIKKSLQEQIALKEELGVESVSELKEKLQVLVEDTEVLKEESKDWKSVAVSIQNKYEEAKKALAARPTHAYATYMRGKVRKLYQESKKLKGMIESQNAAMIEASGKFEVEKKALREKINKMSTSLQEQRTRIDNLATSLEESSQNLVKLHKVKEALARKLVDYKQLMEERSKPVIRRSPAEAIAKQASFRETKAINSYWSELVKRHGASILPYKERITSRKTFKEASSEYIKVMCEMDESVQIDKTRISTRLGESAEARGARLEKVGVSLKVTGVDEKLPQGWV
jgi:hypothetical protein